MVNCLKVLFLALALSVPCFATQVTMTATTQPNFHPSGLPAAVTGTCSATNNSVTVTGTFRTNWIGIGGYKINLGGVDYTVSDTPSSTSLTLTAPYAGSTSASTAFTVYPFVVLRFYALQRFTASGTLELIQAGTPGSSAWYRQLGCSVIGTTLYVPQSVLPSTTDAVNPSERSARWYAGFYQLSGALISAWQGLENFPLDYVPNPKTWAQAVAFASTGTPPPPDFATYTKTQIDALFAGGGGGSGVPLSRILTAGTGLQGGGDLSADRTFSLTTMGGLTPGAYTNANITVDAQGRITVAGNGSSGGGSGTVTSITAGAGLNGGTITTSGVIDIANVISANSCNSCNLSFNGRGQITSASDGSGGGGGAAPGQYSLFFQGFGSHVFGGYYWPGSVSLPPFSYEAWFKPTAGGQCGCYMIADGYGGSHSVLWGVGGESVGPELMTGNIFNGTCGTSFGSIDGPQDGEWAHGTVTWTGNEMITTVNGVASGIVPFVGPRTIAGITTGTSQLYIGGSDHNNFHGYMSMVRGWEGSPLYSGSFRPDRTFAHNLYPYVASSLNYDLTQGQHIVSDNSAGFLGTLHPGKLEDANYNTGGPYYLVDTSAPQYDLNTIYVPPDGYFAPAPPTPGGALVFDSFSRKNVNYVTNQPFRVGPMWGEPQSGTCSATNGSATITSADFAQWNGLRDFFMLVGGGQYQVRSVVGTTITLTGGYQGATSASTAYVVRTTETGSLGKRPYVVSAVSGTSCTLVVGTISVTNGSTLGISSDLIPYDSQTLYFEIAGVYYVGTVGTGGGNNNKVTLTASYAGTTDGAAALVISPFNCSYGSWGVATGRGVALTGFADVTYVETGVADVDVRVDRVQAAYSSKHTSIVFRWKDALNFWYVTASGLGTGNPSTCGLTTDYGRDIQLVKVANGASIVMGNATDPAAWTTLRVVAKGNNITVFGDFTSEMSVSDSFNNTQTKHGMGMLGGLYTVGGGGLARWDNFTILNAP